MKTKKIVLTLLLISNLIFLPKICLAVAFEEYGVVNKHEKRCGGYSLNYFSLLSYRPPKNWEIIKSREENIAYCSGVKDEYVKPRISGLSFLGWSLLLISLVVITGLFQLFVWGMGKHFINNHPHIKKTNIIFSLFFRIALIIIFLFLAEQSMFVIYNQIYLLF